MSGGMEKRSAHSCAKCGKPIDHVFEEERCRKCGVVVHDDCYYDHVTQCRAGSMMEPQDDLSSKEASTLSGREYGVVKEEQVAINMMRRLGGK